MTVGVPRSRSIAIAVALVAALGSAVVPAPADAVAAEPERRGSGAPVLLLKHGRLSADLVAAPLADVLAEISRISGGRVRVHGPAEGTVSHRLDDVPLPAAVGRLLIAAGVGYVLCVSPDGIAVQIVERGDPAIPQPPARRRAVGTGVFVTPASARQPSPEKTQRQEFLYFLHALALDPSVGPARRRGLQQLIGHLDDAPAAATPHVTLDRSAGIAK